MNGGTTLRVLAILLLVGVAIGIGVGVYNAGMAAGLNEQIQQAVASGQPVPAAPYGYAYGPYWHGPWGWGFGFFGIFFWILGIFLIFGLLRFAFGWGRWRGRGPGGWGPGGRGRSEMVEDWHRELHRREADEPGQRAGT